MVKLTREIKFDTILNSKGTSDRKSLQTSNVTDGKMIVSESNISVKKKSGLLEKIDPSCPMYKTPPANLSAAMNPRLDDEELDRISIRETKSILSNKKFQFYTNPIMDFLSEINKLRNLKLDRSMSESVPSENMDMGEYSIASVGLNKLQIARKSRKFKNRLRGEG